MQTEDQEFDAEVRAFVASFGCVQRTRYGRWLAWLDPTHDFVREGLQPPGQVNVYLHGEPTCTAQNSYWDGQPPIGFAGGKPLFGGPLDLRKSADRELWRQAWAARPYFESAESARRKIEEWIWDNRPDIVRTARNEVREAIAYRRRMNWKAREQAHA